MQHKNTAELRISRSRKLPLTQHGLVAPQCRHVRAYERGDRQVHEPDEESGAKVQVEAHLRVVVCEHERLAKFEQEPRHNGEAEREDQVAGPRLPLADVRDDVDLHLCRGRMSLQGRVNTQLVQIGRPHLHTIYKHRCLIWLHQSRA